MFLFLSILFIFNQLNHSPRWKIHPQCSVKLSFLWLVLTESSWIENPFHFISTNQRSCRGISFCEKLTREHWKMWEWREKLLLTRFSGAETDWFYFPLSEDDFSHFPHFQMGFQFFFWKQHKIKWLFFLFLLLTWNIMRKNERELRESHL